MKTKIIDGALVTITNGDCDINDELEEEYDLSQYELLPNPYAKILNKQKRFVELEPDVQEVFKTSEEVNNALRAIIQAMPKRSSKYNKEKHLAEA